MKIDIKLLRERLEKFINNKENTIYFPKNALKSNLLNLKFLASEPWRGGGLTGGNCWGGQATEPVDVDQENDIILLDKFLTEFYPNTNFLTYRKILDKISYYEYNDYEYYGNYTIYKFKYITLDDIISIFEN